MSREKTRDAIEATNLSRVTLKCRDEIADLLLTERGVHHLAVPLVHRTLVDSQSAPTTNHTRTLGLTMAPENPRPEEKVRHVVHVRPLRVVISGLLEDVLESLDAKETGESEIGLNVELARPKSYGPSGRWS